MARRKRRDMATPLDELPAFVRERVEKAVAQDEPPAKWLYFGAPGSPRPLAKMESRAWLEWHWARGIEPGSRTFIPLAVRKAVLDRDGLVCQLCGEPVERGDVHLDHIHPRSRGGKDTIDNLQVTHSTCNIRKGARVIRET